MVEMGVGEKEGFDDQIFVRNEFLETGEFVVTLESGIDDGRFHSIIPNYIAALPEFVAVKYLDFHIKLHCFCKNTEKSGLCGGNLIQLQLESQTDFHTGLKRLLGADAQRLAVVEVIDQTRIEIEAEFRGEPILYADTACN